MWQFAFWKFELHMDSGSTARVSVLLFLLLIEENLWEHNLRLTHANLSILD